MSSLAVIQWAKSVARTVIRTGPRDNFIHRWRRVAFGDPGLPAGPIESVLVLCHGNLFRSPFVEALLGKALPELRVSSGGLHAADQHTSPERAVALAEAFGIDLKPHRTRPLSEAIVAEADLILVMEGAQRAEFLRRYPHAGDKVRVLGDFLDAEPRALPDPWSEDASVARTIFVRVEQAAADLAVKLAAHVDTSQDSMQGEP